MILNIFILLKKKKTLHRDKLNNPSGCLIGPLFPESIVLMRSFSLTLTLQVSEHTGSLASLGFRVSLLTIVGNSQSVQSVMFTFSFKSHMRQNTV